MAKRGPKPQRQVGGNFKEKIKIPVDFDQTIKSWRSDLAKALKAQGVKEGLTAMQRVAVTFFEDKAVMTSVLKHMLPQLKAVELKSDADAPFRLIIELGTDPVPKKKGKEAEK